MISYEIAMGMSVIPVFMMVGDLNLGQVISYQSHCWLIFKAPLSLEIFTTSRKSIWGCWSVLGMCSVPCQIPTMSVGEAGVDGCVAVAGALVCPAGDEGGTACAFVHRPFPASSKAIAPAAQRVNPSKTFPPSMEFAPDPSRPHHREPRFPHP